MIDVKTIQKGIFLTKNGKIKEAEEFYLDLLKENPDNSILLSTIGLFYVNIGDFDKASKYLEDACKLNESLGTVSALGFAEFERHNYEKSAEILEKALQYGNNIEIYNELIMSLFEIANYQKAVKYADEMYEKYPDNSLSIAHKIKALTQTGMLLEAHELCVETLKKNSNLPSLWFHLGYLKELIFSDDRSAKECYKMASKLGSLEADYNIGVSCAKLREFDEAEKYYKKMLTNFPNNVDASVSLGMLYLTQKKFTQGYEYFYKRELPKIVRDVKNIWKPNDIINDNVTILCEQGIGDQIQFARYLPFLKSKTITIAMKKSLQRLMKENFPSLNIIDYSEINKDEQMIRITDLAFALNIDFDNIPSSKGYLDCQEMNIESDKPKIGLCWEAGSAGIRTLINRTINVKAFEPIFDLANIQLYSLQYIDTLGGNEKYPQMINLAKDFNDFYDTASAIKSMDAIITVDTSIAHIAGALGKKTYLLLPYTSDWRWFDDTKTTPWYDSIEIFKQKDNISWEKEIMEITKILKKY